MMASERITPAPLWTAAEAAQATGGDATGDWAAEGVSIDTRTLVPGDLFVAIQGPSHDGHDYVERALADGAAAALVSRDLQGVPSTAPLLRVADTEEALRALGIAARQRTDARICAITGSVGKTGTKELLAHALGAQGSVAATVGNLNNHYGLPLSLARMPIGTNYGVFEMGMNHAGEITPLSEMAQPHVSIVTTIESVHIEYFENVEGIADAKAEIFAGMQAGGVVILNGDNPHFARLEAHARDRGLKQVLSFGSAPNADARPLSISMDEAGTHVTATIDGQHLSYRLRLRGRHWAMNSLAVLLAAAAVGADMNAAAEAMDGVMPPKGRGQSIQIYRDGGAITVIDETYNASPVAVKAALDVLAETVPNNRGRRVVVLGDMLELGDTAISEHLGIATHLQDMDVDQVFVCGEHMPEIMNALPDQMQGARAKTSEQLADIVNEAVQPGDLVLVKGSAGSQMGKVVDKLKASAMNANDNGGS